jgi:hypothetical protein
MRPTALWFGLGGAPIAWSVLQLIVYPIAAHACFPHGVPLAHSEIGHVNRITIVVSVLALAVGLMALRTAIHNVRVTRAAAGEPSAPPDEVEGPWYFLAYAGLVASVVFSLGIVMTALAPFVVSPCW